MATVAGLSGQQIVWYWFYQVYGQDGVVEVLVAGGLTSTGATRMAGLMRSYWEPRDNVQKRRGDKHFPAFVYKLVNKPAELDPFGDYSLAWRPSEHYVLGSKAVEQILAIEPAYTPVAPIDQNYDFEDIYDGLSYLLGFTSGIARFLALIDTIWIPYLGESDTEFPDIPSFASPETEE